MPKFSVHAVVSGSKYLGEFEAATAEEAVELALVSDAASVPLCSQCAKHCENAECATAEAELIEE